MDYNNFSHYAKERMASLRGENRKVERWSNFAVRPKRKRNLFASISKVFKELKVAQIRRSRS